jgi:hypothetical protein
VERRRSGRAVRFLRGAPADTAPQQPFPADWRAASAGSESSGRQRLKLVVRLIRAAHEIIDALWTCGDRDIGRLEPRPLGQNAAIRGARDRSLLVGSTSKRGSRHRHSLRLAQHLGGSEANRNLSRCTSKLCYPHTRRRGRADCLGVHTAVEPLSLFRLSRHCCNNLWPCRSLASICSANAKSQCNSGLTIHSRRRCLIQRFGRIGSLCALNKDAMKMSAISKPGLTHAERLICGSPLKPVVGSQRRILCRSNQKPILLSHRISQ